MNTDLRQQDDHAATVVLHRLGLMKLWNDLDTILYGLEQFFVSSTKAAVDHQ